MRIFIFVSLFVLPLGAFAETGDTSFFKDLREYKSKNCQLKIHKGADNGQPISEKAENCFVSYLDLLSRAPEKFDLAELEPKEPRIFDRAADCQDCAKSMKNDSAEIRIVGNLTFIKYKDKWVNANTRNFLEYKDVCGLIDPYDMEARATWTEEQSVACDKILHQVWIAGRTGDEEADRVQSLVLSELALNKLDTENPYPNRSNVHNFLQNGDRKEVYKKGRYGKKTYEKKLPKKTYQRANVRYR